MTAPKDKELYEKIKKEIISKHPKHSAYRSGLIVKAYKEAGGKYEGKKPINTGLKRWFDENECNVSLQSKLSNLGDINKDPIEATKIFNYLTTR